MAVYRGGVCCALAPPPCGEGGVKRRVREAARWTYPAYRPPLPARGRGQPIRGITLTHALFRLPPRPDGLRRPEPVGKLRGGLDAKLHAGLHGRGVRGGRYRLDQDRLPLCNRFRPRAIHRPQGPGLHHRRGLERRDAGGQVGVQAQHPPLEPLALYRRGEGLPRAGRHDHHPLRRPAAGIARHQAADLLRERIRVPGARRSDRHLRLRGDPREPEDRDRAGPRRALARGAADHGARGRAVPACRSRRDDKWGNTSDQMDRTLRLAVEGAAVAGLPRNAALRAGQLRRSRRRPARGRCGRRCDPRAR